MARPEVATGTPVHPVTRATPSNAQANWMLIRATIAMILCVQAALAGLWPTGQPTPHAPNTVGTASRFRYALGSKWVAAPKIFNGGCYSSGDSGRPCPATTFRYAVAAGLTAEERGPAPRL